MKLTCEYELTNGPFDTHPGPGGCHAIPELDVDCAILVANGCREKPIIGDAALMELANRVGCRKLVKCFENNVSWGWHV